MLAHLQGGPRAGQDVDVDPVIRVLLEDGVPDACYMFVSGLVDDQGNMYEMFFDWKTDVLFEQ